MLKFLDDLSKELEELPVEKDLHFWREEVLLALTGDDAERLRQACGNNNADINGSYREICIPAVLLMCAWILFPMQIKNLRLLWAQKGWLT